MTNHMQPDDQQSPAPEVETSQGAAPETMPAEATPLPAVSYTHLTLPTKRIV